MTTPELAALLRSGTTQAKRITVSLSNELVHLLSEQMYQSPLKAIEELVVNSYDADATQCILSIPLPPDDRPTVLVFDDGVGMTPEGLENLWQIGRSNKRTAEIEQRMKRKQIGKFGIGKLATYSIAYVVTYLSKTDEGLFSVTMDFRNFRADPTGGTPIQLDVQSIDPAALGSDTFAPVWETLGLGAEEVARLPQWTLAILEDLKPKLGRVRRRDLNWVLSTAMPLKSDFSITLNGSVVESRKAAFESVVEFDVSDLPVPRLEAHESNFSSNTRVENGTLMSDTFPNGITGTVLVTEQTLYGGKSDDLARSHGFFVRVRDRLVDEADPLFGLKPLSYSTFNRFRADIRCDDLDAAVTASREGFEASDEVRELRSLLSEIFYEARARYKDVQDEREKKQKNQREADRNYVDEGLIEHPLADALAEAPFASDLDDDETGDDWFYVVLADDVDRSELVRQLYSSTRSKYRFVDVESGGAGRAVSFDPYDSTFWVNVDHPLVQAHDAPEAQPLLHDLLTAEVLLEVYLRETGTPLSAIADILERRDILLRSLASDHLTSVTAIAARLRESADDERDLEVNLVLAARALGFVAHHIGGGEKPDGVARFSDYPDGENRITLEAKSSEDVPSLGAIDFSGIKQHVVDEPGATGCLLVAPSYPGSTKADDAQAAKRAQRDEISCWTVEQLARVVEASQARHISASDVMRIIRTAFSPDQVAAAVDDLLSNLAFDRQALYAAVIDALRSLDGRMKDSPRTIDLVAGEITGRPEFKDASHKDITKAVKAIAGASQGLLGVASKGRLVVRGDYEELERRVSSLTGRPPATRRSSTFAESERGTVDSSG